jgi:cytochrome c biogenesis protein CcmG/thiol:disulfide interchange protein DsbE
VRLLTHRFALRAALALLVVALLGYGLLAHAGKLVGAPALPHTALQGAPVTIADLRGHAEAIVFFASWCGPCRQEAPAVERFARSSAGRDHVLAIDYDDYGNVHAFLRRYHWTFPVLSDPNGTTGDAYGAGGLPTWVFLNARGKIVERESGPKTVVALESALRSAGVAAR